MPEILHRKIVTVMLVAALFWLGRSVWLEHRQRADVSAQVHELESKVAQFQHDNQSLASASAYFRSDSYLERQARLKLNYKLADEQVAFVYKGTASRSAGPEETFREQVLKMPDWKKWWYYLLGY